MVVGVGIMGLDVCCKGKGRFKMVYLSAADGIDIEFLCESIMVSNMIGSRTGNDYSQQGEGVAVVRMVDTGIGQNNFYFSATPKILEVSTHFFLISRP